MWQLLFCDEDPIELEKRGFGHVVRTYSIGAIGLLNICGRHRVGHIKGQRLSG